MASERSKTSIEQDWQEVDDVCSVHSLPSSVSDGELVERIDGDGRCDNQTNNRVQDGADSIKDGHIDLIDLARSTTTIKAELPHTLSNLNLNPPATTATTTTATTGTNPGSTNDTDKEANGTPAGVSRISISSLIHEREADKVPSPQLSPPASQSQDADGSSSSQASDASFATQNDVVVFSNRLRQLQSLLRDVVREVAGHMERYVSFRTPVIYKLHDTVRMLSEQMDELCPIVKACAEHLTEQNREQYMDPSELPLNANLPQWTDELRTSLLGFQVQVDSQIQHRGLDGRFSPTPVSPVSGFSKSADDLERLRLAMTEFLPLIKVDYGEFRTKHMSIPTSASPIPGRRRNGGVDPAISALRQAFYGMRDEIRKVLDLVVTIHSFDLTSPIAKDAPATIKSLSSLRDAIMLILTNNPSEWIESDLNHQRKILSYPAFIALSPEVLHDVTCSLQQVREDLDVTADKETPENMVYRHQIVLLTEGGQLEEIQSTASFLESLLIPGMDD